MKYLNGDFNNSHNSHREKKKRHFTSKIIKLDVNQNTLNFVLFYFCLFLFYFFLIIKVSEKIPGVKRVDEKNKLFKVEFTLFFFAFHGNSVHCPAEEHNETLHYEIFTYS